MKTGTLKHTARHVLLCGFFCVIAMRPFVYGQSITELKSKAEDGDTQAQLALAKAQRRCAGTPKLPSKGMLMGRQP
ncbi:MAG: hypothetical protein ACLQJF_08645 [Candidatus Sulfotelmatobacter sp.]|jgi:hypothetical protein